MSNMTKIYYLSDTHLEIINQYNYDSKRDYNYLFHPADILVLAGDICSLEEPALLEGFIEQACQKYKNVVYVPGNHEYYGVGLEDGKLILNYFQNSFDNLTILDITLNRTTTEIQGIKFFGSTLWTDMNDRKSKYFVSHSTDDNKEIKTNSDILLDLHHETVNKIDWSADVIVTHHCPILREHSLHPMSDITYGFCCTQLEDKIKESNVQYWIFGHTHDNISEYVGNTLVTSNQVGYPLEHMKKTYTNKTLVL